MHVRTYTRRAYAWYTAAYRRLEHAHRWEQRAEYFRRGALSAAFYPEQAASNRESAVRLQGMADTLGTAYDTRAAIGARYTRQAARIDARSCAASLGFDVR
jgi:hypothetical protein